MTGFSSEASPKVTFFFGLAIKNAARVPLDAEVFSFFRLEVGLPDIAAFFFDEGEDTSCKEFAETFFCLAGDVDGVLRRTLATGPSTSPSAVTTSFLFFELESALLTEVLLRGLDFSAGVGNLALVLSSFVDPFF